MYREQIRELIDAISGTEDAEFLFVVEDVLKLSSEYVMKVVALEAVYEVGKLTRGADEYRLLAEDMDKSRSLTHNSLIGKVKAMNNLCRQHRLPLIFKGNEEARIEVAGFAQALVDEYFATRRL